MLHDVSLILPPAKVDYYIDDQDCTEEVVHWHDLGVKSNNIRILSRTIIDGSRGIKLETTAEEDEILVYESMMHSWQFSYRSNLHVS